ncbi:hypothetical protein PoB_004310200 [Plakobranchus ocellatus]|uniref:Uncharacterized protein n=1 Tax=Plakobranchus ocellatus TaxID=259542 RepID=A0AAV4BAZ4_9GAST|nr:hypothetical protein PoB_004310200 [Plakobranchus ocellatus]
MRLTTNTTTCNRHHHQHDNQQQQQQQQQNRQWLQKYARKEHRRVEIKIEQYPEQEFRDKKGRNSKVEQYDTGHHHYPATRDTNDTTASRQSPPPTAKARHDNRKLRMKGKVRGRKKNRA